MNSTEDTLSAVYNSLVKEFDKSPSNAGYNRFVEAVTEITEAYNTACTGPSDSRVHHSDVPGLVQEYSALMNNSENLRKLRDIFGKLLCVESEALRRERRDTHCPDPCTCPEGGLEKVFFCTCKFFHCIDPDDIEQLFGIRREKFQSLGFVVDTTGSMEDEIIAAKEVITNMLAREEDIDVLAYMF